MAPLSRPLAFWNALTPQVPQSFFLWIMAHSKVSMIARSHSGGSLGARISAGSLALEPLQLIPHLYAVTSRGLLQQAPELDLNSAEYNKHQVPGFLRIQELGFTIFWFQASTG